MIVNPLTNQTVPLHSTEGKALLKQYIHSYNQHTQSTLQLGGSSEEELNSYDSKTIYKKTK